MRKILKQKKSQDSKDPVWLTTFSDAMSLMLTFFVMLFAATSLEKGKFEDVLGSLKGALGIMDKTKPAIVSSPRIIEKSEQILEELRDSIVSQNLTDMVKVRLVREGIRISLSSSILFDLGEATLRSEVLPLLDEILKVLKKVPNDIIIEGHTDNLPIHTEKFPSNWELSAARAISVARYFILKGISPSRIGVVGYADSRPLYPNDTPEHRAANRRVEIFIKRSND